MRFRYRQIASLPPLAWRARVDRGQDTVVVFHGTRVEAREQAFVEGAWDGDFGSLDLRSTVLCGTGGVASRDGVRFHASTDQHGVLFSVRSRDAIHVSNSPAFAMAGAGEAPDPIYPFYPYDLVAIFRAGLHRPDGGLRLASGNTLHVHYTTVVSIDRQGRARFERHPLCEAPLDFRSYETLLCGAVGRVLANAADARRAHRHAPLVALSRGYDTTASAVLAARAGASQAFTYVDSMQGDPRRDSGVVNARALGMSCLEHDRWDYLSLREPREAEFGYGPLSSSAPLAALEEALAGRVLVVGETGDPLWDPARARVFDAMSRPWIRFTLGLSAIEYRLRVGYVVFAVPCIAARHSAAIRDIATSAEMRPWSVGGTYDRPIPRRIGEEAGLARDAFGKRKAASSHSHLNDASRFARSSLERYRAFVREQHAGVSASEVDRWRARAERRQRFWDTLRPRQRYVRSNAVLRRFPFVLNAPPIPIPWDFMFTFQWTAATVRERYTVPEDARPDDARDGADAPR
ncbi:MAG TPA: hypothetical protein VGI14_15580 [Casimicrobiaceae bacterium]